MSKRDAPATHRNRDPILEVLRRHLVRPARLLEIASGTGQHAVYFAEHLPHVMWQPSDGDPTSLESIESWRVESGLANLSAPIHLDAATIGWPLEPVDAVFNANMIHISPWESALGLMAGCGRVLLEGGLLFLYGPFMKDGVHTAPSNAAFDQDLRERNSEWGIRDLEEVELAAANQGLLLKESNSLPANNMLLVFQRNAELFDGSGH